MKIFFDTNVYVAETLLGEGAQRLFESTLRGRWRIFTSAYVLNEVGHVLVDDLGFSRRLAILAKQRILRRSSLVQAEGRAIVPGIRATAQSSKLP